MELLFVIAGLVAGGVLLSDQRARLRRLEDRIEMLLRRIDALDAANRAAPAAPVASVPRTVAPAPAPSGAPPPPPPLEPAPAARPLATPVFRRAQRDPAHPSRSFAETFEALVGGTLPIWIGGIALVLAGVFLVRYSIEAGLLGPGVRCVLAGLLGLGLLVASEAAHRLPRLADDPRVAQALAGAGIASLFGTLYMAAELYGLIPPLIALGLLVLVTVAALLLSLRHGPPTAIMGLIGGFAAPYVAGLNAGSLVPLLIYLGLLMAGLFALAVHRGWLWLALAASGGGILWTLALIATDASGQQAAVGLFVVLAAIGAALALPRAGGEGWHIRLVPMAAGFLQLAFLAPLLSFSAAAWALYAALSAAMILLAWRDPRLTPGVAGALALVVILLAGAHDSESRLASLAAAGTIALFAIPAHLLARRAEDGRWWAAVAVAGGTIPLLIAMGYDRPALGEALWGTLALAGAVPCLWLAWRSRADAKPLVRPSPGLAGAAAAAMLLLFLAGVQWLPTLCGAAVATAAALAALTWGEKAGDAASRAVGLGGLVLAALFTPVARYVDLLLRALEGVTVHFPLLPTRESLAVEMLVPTLLLAGVLAAPALVADGRVRRVLVAACATFAGLILYTLAKLPLAIGDDAAFLARGFLERALITQLLFAIALAGLWRGPARWSPGFLVLLAIALGRIVWFDVLLLNPLFVAQQVGSLPVLNAVTLHLLGAACWLWLAMRTPAGGAPALAGIGRAGALGAMILTLMAAVRQGFHGTRLDAAEIFRGEQYAYSAVLLLLGALWLWRGIVSGTRWLRVAGLALLTLVTFKVFLIDAAVLEGLLRVLSFLGLGGALIAIGWGYGRFVARQSAPDAA